MLLIYTPRLTNRLQYVFEFIFTEKLGVNYEITTNISYFLEKNDCAKINYSPTYFENTPQIFFDTTATSLLFEKSIKKDIKVNIGYTKKYATLFPSSNTNNGLPFDIFAATFFLISRYEEYLPHPTDQHGRYPAECSIAYKYRFLEQPIVDIWILWLKDLIIKKFEKLCFKQRQYKYIPTYDIDIAYCYAHKGITRNVGGYLSALININKHGLVDIKQRTRVLLGMQPDYYDTYQWQYQLQNKYGFRNPIYFFLVGEYGMYDRNISLERLSYQQLIQYIGDFYEVGIHPSYDSNKNIKILNNEINALSKVLKKDIERSRQHYIKLKIPNTYQNLIELDILKDYSMGYPSHIGFRAGTASSFLFYDLSLDIPTKLRLYPFMVMDVTLKDYMKLSPTQAIERTTKLIENVKKVKGLFTTIWHNHTLSNIHGWQGWQPVYEAIVKEAVK